MLRFVAQLCPTFCDPMDCSPLGSSIHGILQAKVLEWAAMPSSKGSCQPRDRIWVSAIEPRSPSLQLDSLLSEPLRKPKNPGVGSLSLLQRNFPTQESNWGLLHCRQILYCLSHQGSPFSIPPLLWQDVALGQALGLACYSHVLWTYSPSCLPPPSPPSLVHLLGPAVASSMV